MEHLLAWSCTKKQPPEIMETFLGSKQKIRKSNIFYVLPEAQQLLQKRNPEVTGLFARA